MNILIVEDNLAHQKITEYVLKRNKLYSKIFVAHDGQEVLDYLYRKNGFSNQNEFPIPDLILLDLNLPKRDGREVLKIIKEDSTLENIPIIIVSTSNREEDINYAYQLGVVGYVSKSLGFDKFCVELGEVVKKILGKKLNI